LKIVGLKMSKIQSSVGRMDKCKIAILNIDFILNWIILGLRNMEVLNFAIPKWVYMWKSVETCCARPESIKQWLAPSWILPPFWSFEKTLLLHYFFYKLMFSNRKFQMSTYWIIEHLCLAAILNFSSFLKCYIIMV
jgi:hypothetical protein